jgi:hypothetical protein
MNRSMKPLILSLVLVAAAPASAQLFEEYRHTVEPPYAGRHEARIGGASEPADEKLRLDIGASIDILTIRDSTTPPGMIVQERNRFSAGADFFTWSRLRAEENFKFPVEAVDYYFGVNLALKLARLAGHRPLIAEIRTRVAHISAHLVDGSEPFGDSSMTTPAVYSREFFDGMLAADGERLAKLIGIDDASIRPYVGVTAVFHAVPAVESLASPYIGLDGFIVPAASLPLVLQFGYEARLNTEQTAAIGEHSTRIGVKLGRPYSNGLLVEAAYYSGRSMYGQLFGARESYVSFGFAIDY